MFLARARRQVNAARTNAGAYYKSVQAIIGQRWNKEVDIKNMGLLPGKLALRFLVNKDGSVRPQDIAIAFDEAGPVLNETAYGAILNTRLPPMPEEMLPVLKDGRFEIVINFVYR